MIEKVALFFIMLFAVIGTGVVSLVLHEYTHYNDFKEFNLTDQRLCLLVIPTGNNFNNFSSFVKNPIAYYHFNYKEELMSPEELARFNKKGKITEVNAYTIGSLIFLFYIICYLIITFARYKDKKQILIYKSKLEEYKSILKDYNNYTEQLRDYNEELENYIKDSK